MRTLILIVIALLIVGCETEADRKVKSAEAAAISAEVQRKENELNDLADLALAQNAVIEGTLQHQQQQIDTLQSRLILTASDDTQSGFQWPVSPTTIIVLLLAVLLILFIGTVIVFIKIQAQTLIVAQQNQHAMKYLAANGKSNREAIGYYGSDLDRTR